jgi:hypothetical protein
MRLTLRRYRASTSATTMNPCTPHPDSNIMVQAIGGAAREPGARPLYPYVLFNKSPLQLRLIGARGGRAHGRNQRARRALPATQPNATPQCLTPGQSTAEAIAVLDAQFPWLRCAEQRRACLQRTRPAAGDCGRGNVSEPVSDAGFRSGGDVRWNARRWRIDAGPLSSLKQSPVAQSHRHGCPHNQPVGIRHFVR